MSRALVITIAVAIVAFVYIRRKEDNDKHYPAKLKASYDYVIVGAGSSGSVSASRLSENQINDVLLIEAGGSDQENPFVYIPAGVAGLSGSEQDWEYYTEPQKHACFAMKENRSYWPRGRVLGGSSSLNYMAYVRGNRHDYDSWAEEGCDGWSYKDVLPYFVKSEDCNAKELETSDYHGRNGPLPVTRSYTTPLQKKYLKAGEELGFKIVDCNGEDQIGFSWMYSTIQSGERWSSYRSFVMPHLDRTNLHVSRNTFVTKVIIKDKRAIGVECIKNGKKITVLAKKEVILSAGAINSPQLLLLSGVGPKEHLHKFGIEVHADLPVGENLQDHFMIPLTYSINVTEAFTATKLQSPWTLMQYLFFRSGYMTSSALEGLGFIYRDTFQKKDNDRYPDIQMHFFSSHIAGLRNIIKFNYKEEVRDMIHTGGDDVESVLFLPTILHPKSRGNIRLKSTDPFDYPAIDPRYLEHPDDVKIAIEGIHFAEQLAQTATMRSIGIDVNTKFSTHSLCAEYEYRSYEFWECYVRHFTLTVYHPTSTCRMGAIDDPTSVVDTRLRVKGIEGLRVVDASVMRNIPSGNTNAPSIMIGEKAADLIQIE